MALSRFAFLPGAPTVGLRRTAFVFTTALALRRAAGAFASPSPRVRSIDMTPLFSKASDYPSPEAAASALTETLESTSKAWEAYVRMSSVFTNLFPVWTLMSALVALWNPALFTWLTTPYFTLPLGLLILSMGIALSPDDFRRVLPRFGAVTLGFIGCYAAMPFLALLLARALTLSPDLAAGTILIGAVNGDRASYLSTYIANGNVALSVMMTTATTIGAIFMTPLISKLLIGTVVPVNAVVIVISTVQIVHMPIFVSMLLNRHANRALKAVLPFSPVVSVVATFLIVGSSVAQCATPIIQSGLSLQIHILVEGQLLSRN